MFNNITSVAIKLIISGSHGSITHLASPLGLVSCFKTDYLKILENPLNKDTPNKGHNYFISPMVSVLEGFHCIIIYMTSCTKAMYMGTSYKLLKFRIS